MSDQIPNKRRKIAGERRPRPTSSTTPNLPESGPEQKTSPTDPTRPTPAASPLARRPRRDRAAASTRASGTGRALGRVPSWLLVGLGVLLALALIGDVVALATRSDAAAEATSTASMTSALRQAPTQAETAAVRVLAYDYNTLQQDADEAKSLMTPDYAGKFQKTVDDLLRAPADQVRAHVEADVKGSGVVNADPSQVDVMLFVDQTSQTTNDTKPQTYLNRVLFRMVKSGDRWLVDDVTAL